MKKGIEDLVKAIEASELVFVDTNIVMEPRLAKYLRKIPREKKRMTGTSIEEALAAGGSDDIFDTPRKKALLKSYEVNRSNSSFYKSMMHGLINTNFTTNGFNEFFNQKDSTFAKIYKELVSSLLYVSGYQLLFSEKRENTILDNFYDKLLNVFSKPVDFSEDTVIKFKTNKKQKNYVKKKLNSWEKQEIENAVLNKKRRGIYEKEPINSLLHRVYNLTDFDIIAQATENEGLIVTADPDFTANMDNFMSAIVPAKNNKEFKTVSIYSTRKKEVKTYSVPVNFEYNLDVLSKRRTRDLKKDVRASLISELMKEYNYNHSEANKIANEISKLKDKNKSSNKRDTQNNTDYELLSSPQDSIALPKKNKGHSVLDNLVLGTIGATSGTALLAGTAFTVYISPEITPVLPYLLMTGTMAGSNLANYGYKKFRNLKKSFEDFKKYNSNIKENIVSIFTRKNDYH